MIVGILGGGQLAQMIALAGVPLGFRFVFYDPSPDCCAAVVGELICGSYDDENRLSHFANKVDVITYEFENVSIKAVQFLGKFKKIYPAQIALESTQDRWVEKSLFKELGIGTPAFCKIETLDDVSKAIKDFGLPLVLKSRKGGYDGRGQVVIRDLAQMESKFYETDQKDLIAEAWVNFKREVSIIAVRSVQGEMAYYDLVENIHKNGILERSFNRPKDPKHQEACEKIGLLMDRLQYVGVLALELFDMGETFLANEYAPRVHNTGHWTIEGANTSQFENHLRAIVGLPLGCTESKAFAGMVNFIGQMPQLLKLKEFRNGHFHDYGKEPRAGRKVGHMTLVGRDSQEIETQASQMVQGLYSGRYY